jgi:rRNA maturation RNase YbeY
MNKKYLNHDTFTDVIGFDNTVGKKLQGDVAISVDRVKENARIFEVSFDNELRRVMAHGLLHFCGYQDKDLDDKALMNQKEEEKLKMFHVKHKTS